MSRIPLWTAICFISFMVVGVSINLLGPSFASLTTRYNMPLADAGTFTMLMAIGATISVLICGRLLDRVDPRYVLCGTAFLLGVGILIIGYAPTLPLALFGTALMGLGFGGMLGAPNYVIAMLYNERAASALNALNVFYGIGAMAGPQVVAFALRQDNITLAFTIAGVLLLALIPALATIRLGKRKVEEGEEPLKRVPVSLITLAPFIFLFFSYTGSEVGFGAWIFTQLATVAQADIQTAAFATTAFWAGLTSGRVVGSIVLRRIAEEQLLPLTITIIGLGTALLLMFQTDTSLSILCAFVVGFGCGPVFPTTLAIVRKAYPTAYGTASGILIGLGNFGTIILPWVQGQIGGGNSGGMELILVLAVVMLVTAVMIQRMIAGSVEGNKTRSTEVVSG
jgi:fucose permease